MRKRSPEAAVAIKTIYDLKPAFQNLLRPLSDGLARAGASANQVTVAALVLSALTGDALLRWPFARWPYLLLPLVLFARMALNAIDGMMAREHNQKTKLGAVLNELSDVISDAVLYLPLAARPEFPAMPVVLSVVLAALTEMTGVVAVQIGASRRCDGPMGKSDRAFVFGALGLALGLGAPDGGWVGLVTWTVALLAALTVINRARRALAEAK